MTVAPLADMDWKPHTPAAGGRDYHSLNVTDYLPQMVWATGPDGQVSYYNAQWYAFTGAAPGTTYGNGWADIIHPDDQARAFERWEQSRISGEPYEVEYRLQHADGGHRWVLARALPVRDHNGGIERWVGTCTDIDDSKQMEQQYELFSRELNHRIKNIFTVMGSLVALSVRNHPEARDFADDLGQRLAALGRAHELARPVARDADPADSDAASLHHLLEKIFAPHPSYEDGRILVTGDDLPIGDHALTALSLLFHELTTNALKHGALSADGRVELTVRNDGDQLHLIWREVGGPVVSGEPKESGFGTKLADLSVRRQLGGALLYRWLPSGLELEAILPVNRLG